MPAKFRFGPVQRRWLHALEHGRRKQARGVLYNGEGYCCLGIAVVAALGGKARLDDHNRCSLDEYEVSALGLRHRCGEPRNGSPLNSLVGLNDDAKLTFTAIAAELRKHPRAYFKASR